MRNALAMGTVAAFAALTACAAPPDVAPFVDSTVALRSAVIVGGDTLERTVRASELKSATKHADGVKAAWTKRVAVMDQAVAYADGLQQIFKAAENSASAVDKVAKGVQSIANAAGLQMPAADVMSVATEGAGFVFKQIENAAAAKALGASLESSDKAVQEIARILAADRKDVVDLLALVESDAVSRLTGADEYKNVPLELDKVETAVKKIIGAIATAAVDDLARVQALNARGDSLRSLLAERDRKIEAVHAGFRAQTDLMSAYGDAMAGWSAAHSQLLRAVRERRPVTAELLVEATTELKAITRKVREL